MAPVRVRFAPSPTGYLHLGGARTALFNWLFARHHGGTFVLRVEDTDRERSRPEHVQAIMDTLAWLGLDWDEGPDRGGPVGPYLQSERLALYRREAERLVADGRAYPCYCSPAELEERRRSAYVRGLPSRYDGRCARLTQAERARLEAEGRRPALRLRAPEGGQTVVEDLIRGRVTFDNDKTLDDFVILKSDGWPTYNFACAVDDAAMGITHVIRAEEHLSNTPRQLLLCRALGFPPPAFAHAPMILAPDRSKLSKRHGAVAVEEFRAGGYLPEAIVNYLALLGWSPGGEREVMSLAEMVAAFSLERVGRTAAIYDVEKLTWMNAAYLRQADPDRLVELVLPRLEAAGFDVGAAKGGEERRAWVRRLVLATRERARTLADFPELLRYFFVAPDGYDPSGVAKHFGGEAASRLRAAAETVQDVEPFTAEAVEAAYRRLAAALGIPAAKLIHPTRLALTGRTVGPGLFEIMELLGRRACRERLEAAVAFLEASGGKGRESAGGRVGESGGQPAGKSAATG